jgi:hypothetical protein
MNFFKGMFGRWVIGTGVLMSLSISGAHASELYFSEYAEPQSPETFRQRYIEIYNASDTQVDLNDYAVLTCQNKCANAVKYNKIIRLDNKTVATERYIPAGGTYVIADAHASVKSTIKNAAAARGHVANTLYITGNDPLALVKKESTWSNDTQNWKNQIKHYTVLDVIGTPKTSTSIFEGVCGNYTLANKTMVRKEGVQGTSSWATSKGTNATDCHWDIKAANDWSDIGQHSPGAGDSTAPVITLIGAQVIELDVGGTYSELKANATDNVDTIVQASIVIDSTNVDTSSAGTYVVTYDVDDSSGNSAAQVVRTVIVKPWNFNNVDRGWIANNDATTATGAGAITLTTVTTKGIDASSTAHNYPNFQLNSGANINPKAGQYVAVTMKNKSPNTKFALGAFTGGSSPNGSKFSTYLAAVPASQSEFKTIYFNMKTSNATTNWNMAAENVVTGLQMRIQFANGSTGAKAGDIEISKVVVSPSNSDTVAPTLSIIRDHANSAKCGRYRIAVRRRYNYL